MGNSTIPRFLKHWNILVHRKDDNIGDLVIHKLLIMADLKCANSNTVVCLQSHSPEGFKWLGVVTR